MESILEKAWKSGKSGAESMVVSVTTFMWMRTIMNYQYRYGGNIPNTIRDLYHQGGVFRFYRGYSMAIIQGPLSRFGDTFSNTYALTVLEPHPNLPITVKTGVASILAGCFRILLTPIDTLKTVMQVEGSKSRTILETKVKEKGFKTLYYGALASSTATMVGHYPWFVTFNYLDTYLPHSNHKLKQLSRNAFIGFLSSIVSDTCSNCFRVIKTYKQTHQDTKDYLSITKEILRKDGWTGFLGRGLPIRWMTNGLQGLLFTVLWKAFQESS